MGLSYELEKRGIAVFSGDISSVEELVDDKRPHLIALVGIRGAMEVSTLLEEQDRNTTPRVAVIAARRDLSRLWGLNRDVVVSLLATEMGDKVVAGRLEALARQAAKKRGEILEGPAPTSLGPRSIGDAFTTVAPQAVAAIQLVKQAHQGAVTVPAAIEINAMARGQESLDEIDSADLESDRPPPDAPLPSPSLLQTQLGLGIRAMQPNKANPSPFASFPGAGEKSFDPDVTSTYDRAPSSVEADATLEEPGRDGATEPPATFKEEAMAEGSPGAAVDIVAETLSNSEPNSTKDDTPLDEPFIDTDALLDSLRSPGEPAKFESMPAEPGGVDHEPDSSELTRPGKTVLGLGVRNPVIPAREAGIADERLTIPDDAAIQSKLLAESHLDESLFNLAGSEITPPSGTAAAPSVRERHSVRASAPPPNRKVPAVLLGLLAAAAAAGAYVNAQRHDNKELPKISTIADDVEKSAPDDAMPSAAPTAALPGTSTPSPTPDSAPSDSAPSDSAPSDSAPSDSAAAKPTNAKDAPQPAEDSAQAEPDPASPTASASAAILPVSGALSDELLQRYLTVASVTPKTCTELVPNPKQGVRDPAAEGSVPWQAARKAIVRGDLAAAQASMCEAAFINPASPALEALALLYVTEGAATEALVWLDKAEAVRPGVRDTLELRGAALSQLGQIGKARQVWLQALNVKEEDMGRRGGVADEDVAVARQHMKQGDLPRAERRLRRAVVLNPKSSLAMATLAELFLKKNQTTLAQGLAESSIAAEPFFPDAYVVLADVDKAQGNLQKAREHLERALQIRPDFWAAKKALRELDQKP